MAAPSSRGLAAFEVAWIFLVFFLFAASPPPDVGESHYLVKAKHYWQPAWCAGDLFLESRDAHQTFYWTFGWLTQLCSLSATAWIGRGVTWALLAWSWRRLSWAVVPQPLMAILSAALLLLLLRQFHLAGEWIVGGVEAKSFAYGLVFLALEALVRGRWTPALLLAGAAGAFHVLVGGWTAVAIGLAWLISGTERPRWTALVPAALGGLILALPGLVPALALNAGADQALKAEAARIYVFERLSHHLVYHRFPDEHIARFGILLAGWGLFALWTWNVDRLRPLHRIAVGTIVLAAVGVAIDQGLITWTRWSGGSGRSYELAAAPLLRYYWFRLSDALVPIAVSLSACLAIVRLKESRPQWASALLATAIVLAGANLADVCYWRSQRRIPGAVLQPRPTADSDDRWWGSAAEAKNASTNIEQWYDDWRATCAWIAENTPEDAKFVTPREQQTFKWYAGRAEVANWKDVPQDAAGLVAWRSTLVELYPPRREHRLHDLAAFSDAELVRLARKHQAQYIVVDQTRAHRAVDLARVYPAWDEENRSFAVYRVPPAQP